VLWQLKGKLAEQVAEAPLVPCTKRKKARPARTAEWKGDMEAVMVEKCKVLLIRSIECFKSEYSHFK
jgi:hypothetical protein